MKKYKSLPKSDLYEEHPSNNEEKQALKISHLISLSKNAHTSWHWRKMNTFGEASALRAFPLEKNS